MLVNDNIDIDDEFVPFVGRPNSLEYKSRKPISYDYGRFGDAACWSDWSDDQKEIIDRLVTEHGARFIAFEFIFRPYPSEDNLLPDFNNFIDYILVKPKTDLTGCFDIPLIFFHRIVRNKFIFSKDKFRDSVVCFNSIPLIEFLYITVDSDYTRQKNSSAIKFKGFFAMRSLVGQENNKVVLLVLESLKTNNKLHQKVWELKSAESAKEHWASLMVPATTYSHLNLNHTAAFHAFHWFRNYNKRADDDSIYMSLLDYVESMFPHCMEVISPFAYISHLPFWDPIHNTPRVYPIDMKNDDIPGIYVDNSYETPALLLHFFKVYIILKKMRCLQGIWYETINDSFLSPLGNNEWFRDNIYSILSYLKFKVRGGLFGLNFSRLLSMQLNNAMSLMNLDSNFVLKPL